MALHISALCVGCTACAKACPVEAIAGERGSPHRIDPGRCIECGACGRVCPKGAVEDEAGRPIGKLPRAEWRKPSFDASRCISCGTCEAKCPTSSIAMGPADGDGSALLPLLAAPDSCVSCGWCSFYCPMSCIALAAPAGAEALR